MDDREFLSWHELRLTIPADASVSRLEQPHIAVSSLRVYGSEVPPQSGPAFWVTASRQALAPEATLESWAASIIDAAGDRRARTRQRMGSQEAILAVPKPDDPIGTFIFAVVNQHGYNIMTGAAPDPHSQAELVSVLESIHFEVTAE